MWTLHVAGPLALLCAVAARRRGLAIGLTACLCALTIIRYTPIDQFAVVSVVGAISLLLLEVAALATSSGLGRGLELLSWRHVAWPAAAVGLPLAAVGQLLPRLTGGLSTGGDGLTVGAAAVGVLVLVALIAKSAVDKRLCLLLAVAIYTLVIEYAAADGGYAGRGWPSLQRFYLEVPLACLPVRGDGRPCCPHAAPALTRDSRTRRPARSARPSRVATGPCPVAQITFHAAGQNMRLIEDIF